MFGWERFFFSSPVRLTHPIEHITRSPRGGHDPNMSRHERRNREGREQMELASSRNNLPNCSTFFSLCFVSFHFENYFYSISGAFMLGYVCVSVSSPLFCLVIKRFVGRKEILRVI